MEVEARTLEQRIKELESAAHIATNHDMRFANQIWQEILILRQKQKEKNEAIH